VTPSPEQWLFAAGIVAGIALAILIVVSILERRYRALITRLQDALEAKQEAVGQHPWEPQAQDTGEGLAAIVGEWPGDETDEEVRRALQQMKDSAEVAAIREVLKRRDGFVTIHAMTARHHAFAYCADTPDLSAQIIAACREATEAQKREEVA
jgi:hypothetical protein